MDEKAPTSEKTSKLTINVQCCVGGGGPAGIMLGYLLRRAAAANALAEKLARSAVTLADLESVQMRRMFPVKVIQAIQVQVQNRIINPVLQGAFKPPLPIRIVNALPWLQGLLARTGCRR